ncbi:hypothetical protein JRQ81_009670, partial [Phrynocephalus forsythii]
SKQEIINNSNKIEELGKFLNENEEKLNKQIELNRELQEITIEHSESILKIEMEKSAHMVRIRGVEETKEQDLLNTIIQPLAERMGLEVKELEKEIEFIHRINSRFAKMNKLPRDVRVTFVRREMKEKVMRIMSEEPLTILGKEQHIFGEGDEHFALSKAVYPIPRRIEEGETDGGKGGVGIP